MKKLTDEQKARINHATTTVIVGLLFILCLTKERYGLAFIFLILFVLGVSLYKSIGDEKK